MSYNVTHDGTGQTIDGDRFHVLTVLVPFNKNMENPTEADKLELADAIITVVQEYIGNG